MRGLLTGYGFLEKVSFARYRALPNIGQIAELQTMPPDLSGSRGEIDYLIPGELQQVGGPAMVTVVVVVLLDAAPLGAALSTRPIEIAKATAIIFFIISINPFK